MFRPNGYISWCTNAVALKNSTSATRITQGKTLRMGVGQRISIDVQTVGTGHPGKGSLHIRNAKFKATFAGIIHTRTVSPSFPPSTSMCWFPHLHQLTFQLQSCNSQTGSGGWQNFRTGGRKIVRKNEHLLMLINLLFMWRMHLAVARSRI